MTARAALVFAWARELLAEGGRIVLIEPALRETSRDLLAIRDRLLPAGFFVVAPCLWQGPCPALARERDWCHDSAPWPPEEAAARAGQSRVDYSYLVLARAGEPSTERRLFRVVSDPIVEKGRLRLWGCGPAGRHPLVRLDRDRTPANAGFDEAARGDLLIAADTDRAPATACASARPAGSSGASGAAERQSNRQDAEDAPVTSPRSAGERSARLRAG